MKNAFTLILLILFLGHSDAQEYQNDVQNKLNNYIETPKEIAYLHLNKSTYIKGEQMAFTAYVLNGNNFKKSTATSNLYLKITNDNDDIIREKLLLVKNGISVNTIQLDSSFVSGKYTVSAFTNWMRNFSTPTYFSETIHIIDIDEGPSGENVNSKAILTDNAIDVQFLPESGHLLKNVLNTVGVIAKNQSGDGLANANIEIFDTNNTPLATFQLNQFGIGKFSFIPEMDKTYKARVNPVNDKPILIDLDLPVERNGIILSATTTEKELRLMVKTNSRNKSFFKNETYTLVLHNLKESKVYNIDFNDNLSIPFLFNLENFTPGMNIITLFNSKHEVIAERLFFNPNNLPVNTLDTPKVIDAVDSLEIHLKPRKNADSLNLSISVLPQNSISSRHHHSILSNAFLKPYVKGPIQRADWYLNSIDYHKIQELDKLLITQGWSSYDWNSIFKEEINIRHRFENVLEFKATFNKEENEEEQQFLIHATDTRAPQIVKLPKDEKSFIINNFIHFEDEKLTISRMEGEKLVQANLFIQFSPNSFPEYKLNLPYDRPFKTTEENLNLQNTDDMVAFNSGRELLDEVIVEKKIDKVKERERELSKHRWGRIKIVEYEDIDLYKYLNIYLTTQPGIRNNPNGYGFLSGLASQSIKTTDSNSESTGSITEPRPMQMYLDDVPMQSEFFDRYPMQLVDYVEINTTGLGSGFMGSNGSIRVYTKFDSHFESSQVVNPQTFDYPVAFYQQKKYYVPKYRSQTSDFFKDYGVIDWKPNLTLSESGVITFKIKKPMVDYQLHVQGVSSDGLLFYDIKDVSSKSEDLNK